MSTSQHTTQSGEPDRRFAENQEGESYQKNTRQGGNQGSNQGGNQGYSNDNISGGTQGQSNLGGEHLTKEGKPDMRFAENQEGEPYQKEAGQKGGQVRQGSDNDNYGSRGGQDNQGGSEHLTKEGEPDMRFKENKEAYGQS